VLRADGHRALFYILPNQLLTQEKGKKAKTVEGHRDDGFQGNVKIL